MQVGEGLAAPSVDLKSGDECFICGKNHPAPKPAPSDVPKTAGKGGWDRVSMAGVFAAEDSERKSIFDTYPPHFGTEGHHCLAFSSFVEKGNDVLPRLNYHLDQVDFKPNDPKNIIQLPGRKGCPELKQKFKIDTELRYQTFYMAAKAGKPLQPHLGRHKKKYFIASNALVRRMTILLCNPSTCQKSDQEEFKKKLKKYADAATNYAFIAVAKTKWICHIEHLNILRSSYQKNAGSTLGNWPTPNLDCDPFG